MNAPEREPTTDELAAMAYADGELSLQERRAFEERMASEQALGREVVQYQRLQALADIYERLEGVSTHYPESRNPSAPPYVSFQETDLELGIVSSAVPEIARAVSSMLSCSL